MGSQMTAHERVVQWQNAELGDECEGCGQPIRKEERVRVLVVYSDRSYENCLGIYCGSGCAREDDCF